MQTPSSFYRALLPALVVFAVVAVARAQNQAPPPTPPSNPFFLHDGDAPVVFLGDSITEQKMFTTLIETYALTRFPDWKITFRNAGWGGDTAGMLKRGGIDVGLPRDVIALKPKVVLIDFGMNDARRGDAAYYDYLESTTKLVKDLEKAGARVALITSSPEEKYEPDMPAGSRYNLMLKKYADGLKVVSDNEKVPLVDLYTPMVKYIEAGREADVLSGATNLDDPHAVRLTTDAVHPNWGGHLIMAAIILQALHAPALVSSVSLDAAAHSITSADGCAIEWQDASNGTLRFKRTDEALPWPVPPECDTILKIPGFDPATTLDRYELKVSGLTEALYKLSIDDQDIGTYASSDLANGINLGWVRKGPIYDQEQQLLKTVEDKNDAYFDRWRNVRLFEIPGWLGGTSAENARNNELIRLDAIIADDEKSIETLRKPVTRIFKLEPVTK